MESNFDSSLKHRPLALSIVKNREVCRVNFEKIPCWNVGSWSIFLAWAVYDFPIPTPCKSGAVLCLRRVKGGNNEWDCVCNVIEKFTTDRLKGRKLEGIAKWISRISFARGFLLVSDKFIFTISSAFFGF